MELTLTRSRSRIALAAEIGRGGEGTVFAIQGRSDHVAKIYSAPPDPPKVEKLAAMTAAANVELLKIAAWPLDLLADRVGRTRGFIMPRVSARRDIHELYSPKSRSEAFPAADLAFLVHVAANIARAFSTVHRQGHVVGDVNHGNLLVAPDGTVMFIDCDSFQLRNGNRLFTCDVGVPLFTPPELHGRPFRGLQRTDNHDRFGLGVLLFHLLFMGRHPFAGRYSGATEMPIERAIREYRFAYGPDRALHGMERPPGTIPLETMGATISSLFVSSFGRNTSNAGRPDAAAWVHALEQLKASLRPCSVTASHQFPRHLASCPWCVVEQQTGVRLFGQRVTVPEKREAIDLAALWQLITSAPDPGPDPPLPARRPPPSADLLMRRTIKISRQTIALGIIAAGAVSCAAVGEGGIFLAFVSYGLAYIAWPRPSPQRLAEANRELALAQAAWDSTLARWRREASREAFLARIKELEQARTEFSDLPNERSRRLAKLEGGRETRQRQRYLDRFRIDRATIPKIGSGRTSMLAAYGIETAADIDRWKVLQIPGFGPALTTELLNWRRAHEQNFRFNPSDPTHDADVAAMDRDLAARRQALLDNLRQGPATLRQLSAAIRSARPRLTPLLQQAWTALAIARARRNAL